MNTLTYIIGAAILLFFLFSVVSFVKSLIAFIRKKRTKGTQPVEPEVNVNDVTETEDKSEKEV